MGSVPNESCVSLLFRFGNSFSCVHHQTLRFLQSVIDFTHPSGEVGISIWGIFTYLFQLRRAGFGVAHAVFLHQLVRLPPETSPKSLRGPGRVWARCQEPDFGTTWKSTSGISFWARIDLVNVSDLNISQPDFFTSWEPAWSLRSPILKPIRCVLQNPASGNSPTLFSLYERLRSGTGTTARLF